jgi:phosphatidylglycerol:prolipoprotein diacylglycerol transferase
MLPEPIFWNIHMYGVMIAVGILCAFLTLFYIAKRKGIDERFTDFLFYNGIASIAVGFGFATLFQATYNYIENPEAGFRLGSGMTFIGGLIGGVICFLGVYFIFRKRYTTRLYEVISILPCSILIAHAFGRIGCFFAGCCYGKETDSFLGVRFPDLPHPVHPTQLYEATFLFLMFGITLYLVLKKDFKHNLSLYLISYGIFRFLIEYVRGDDRGELVGFITPSQFWSVFMVLAGVAMIFVMNHILVKAAQNEKIS